jgi:hypothetical protein
LAGASIGDLLADKPIAAECEAACFLTAIRGDLNRALRCCRVVAELQFCADEKPSARIVDCARMKKPSVRNPQYYKKTHTVLVLTLPEFSVRMLFIRTENAVGARSAQVRSWHATVFKTPYVVYAGVSEIGNILPFCAAI